MRARSPGLAPLPLLDPLRWPAVGLPCVHGSIRQVALRVLGHGRQWREGRSALRSWGQGSEACQTLPHPRPAARSAADAGTHARLIHTGPKAVAQKRLSVTAVSFSPEGLVRQRLLGAAGAVQPARGPLGHDLGRRKQARKFNVHAQGGMGTHNLSIDYRGGGGQPRTVPPPKASGQCQPPPASRLPVTTC